MNFNSENTVVTLPSTKEGNSAPSLDESLRFLNDSISEIVYENSKPKTYKTSK